MTRDQLVSELRKYGGYVELGDRTYELVGERVRCVTFGADALEVPLANEQDIAQRLGQPSTVQERGTVRIHHYPTWSLTVAWDHDKRRVANVVCGARGQMPGWFGAMDVLYEWIAAVPCMGPKCQAPTTSLRSFHVRYKRITAVLRAFQLGTPEEFVRGGFLNGRAIERYPRARAAFGALPQVDYARPTSALCEYFSLLLRYRTDAQTFFNRSQFEEISEVGLVALKQMRRANNHLWAALYDIDCVLEDLISPDARRIPQAELIRDWGFPEDDLLQLRADEW